jgi:hypothetical protein
MLGEHTVPRTSQLLRGLATAVVLFLLSLVPRGAALPQWQAFTLTVDGPVPLDLPEPPHSSRQPESALSLPHLPPEWQIADLAWADATNDGSPEWVLLVWRPWRDWAIQSWSTLPSPIADFHGDDGLSCHVILIDPGTGQEIWAGSALPTPLLSLDVGDVDGDGRNELVTLETDYSTGARGPSTHLDIWLWRGFGFWLQSRCPAAGYHQARLTDCTNDGILDIVVR